MPGRERGRERPREENDHGTLDDERHGQQAPVRILQRVGHAGEPGLERQRDRERESERQRIMAIPLSEGSPERRDGDDAKETAAKYYKVIHKHAVAVHETMSLASAAVSFKQPGLVIRGIATDEGAEHDWVRLASGEGYVLANHPTDGKLLETLEPATFKVAHKAVLVRREPSTSSKVLQIKKEGDLLLVDGHLEGWLKVHGVAQDEESSSPLALGWVMIHHQTYGKLVQYLKGEVPTFGDDCAQDGSISATPSR